ncbi:MAG TPA: hypothetical protein DEQ61_18595 [Streptomyces sp.]|nr:hypothetical protein [Streptomyces sp.]
MGCACPSRKKKQQGGQKSGSRGKRRQEQPQSVTVRRIPKSKARQGGKQPNPARSPRDDAFPYSDDREAEAFREELRDITERGSSVRTVSGGLPTLGRRR